MSGGYPTLQMPMCDKMERRPSEKWKSSTTLAALILLRAKSGRRHTCITKQKWCFLAAGHTNNNRNTPSSLHMFCHHGVSNVNTV